MPRKGPLHELNIYTGQENDRRKRDSAIVKAPEGAEGYGSLDPQEASESFPSIGRQLLTKLLGTAKVKPSRLLYCSLCTLVRQGHKHAKSA